MNFSWETCESLWRTPTSTPSAEAVTTRDATSSRHIWHNEALCACGFKNSTKMQEIQGLDNFGIIRNSGLVWIFLKRWWFMCKMGVLVWILTDDQQFMSPTKNKDSYDRRFSEKVEENMCTPVSSNRGAQKRCRDLFCITYPRAKVDLESESLVFRHFLFTKQNIRAFRVSNILLEWWGQSANTKKTPTKLSIQGCPKIWMKLLQPIRYIQ